jgi:hypothetical protein
MQTDAQRIQCSQKHTQKKLIANQRSRSKVIDCVGELLTGSGTPGTQRDVVFTVGSERAKSTFFAQYCGERNVWQSPS